MHHFALIEILAIGFVAAVVFGYLTQRLRLSPIVGYLLAGYVVGPHSPGFVADPGLANQLAQVGVILLMFGVGLHFDVGKLLAVRRIAIPGALVQGLVATVAGAAVARLAGIGLGAAVVLGLGIAIASTVVLTRVLIDNNLLETIHGHVAVGWLIVQDIITVVILVLLPAAAANGGGNGIGLFAAFVGSLVKLALLVAIILLVGGRAIPWLMARIALARSRELFTLTVLAVAIAVATVSAEVFGTSEALGAFLAGLVVGKSRLSHQAAADVLPLRDAFAVLFFISIGMLFEPTILARRPGLVLACLSVIMLLNPLTAAAAVIRLKYSAATALTVGLGLAQIGEFSFILAQQAQAAKLIPAEVFSVLVACSLISIAINPVLFRQSGRVEAFLRRRPNLWRLLNRAAEEKGRAANRGAAEAIARRAEPPRAIVVGYGPVGRRVAAILREFATEPVIVDLNIDTVNNLLEQGAAAIYGDAGRSEILRSAGIEHAQFLLVTLPDLSAAIGVIAHARELNPAVKIIVRARFLGSREALEELGVTAMSFEEEEVARAMAELLVNQSGVAPRP